MVGARLVQRGADYKELMPDEVVVVVPASHPWHDRKQVTLEELRAEPLLIRERGSGTRAAPARSATDCASFPASWKPRRPRRA